MAVSQAASILFKQFAGSQLQIGVINVDNVSVRPDASLDEEHEFSSQIAENPIEDGAVVADHVFLEPDVLRVSGIVSDHPVRFLSGVRNLISGGVSPTIDAFQKLRQIRANKVPITVVTGLTQYTNMMIQSLRIVRNADTGKSLNFQLTLREVQFGRAVTVLVGPERFRQTADKGKTQAPASTATESNRSSLLLRAVRGLGAGI